MISNFSKNVRVNGARRPHKHQPTAHRYYTAPNSTQTVLLLMRIRTTYLILSEMLLRLDLARLEEPIDNYLPDNSAEDSLEKKGSSLRLVTAASRGS